MVLDATAAQTPEANILWGGPQTFNSTTFGLGAWDVVNRNGDSYIAYCWKSIAGYSKVGTYNGTSGTNNVITTGFEPGFVMIKSTTLATAGSIWFMYDNKRNTSNPRDTILRANDSSIESLSLIHI